MKPTIATHSAALAELGAILARGYQRLIETAREPGEFGRKQPSKHLEPVARESHCVSRSAQHGRAQ